MVLAGGIRPAVQVAAERAIGAAPIETLIFDAVVGMGAPATPDDGVWLRVRLRPWRSASVRASSQLRLRSSTLSAWLLRVGWPGQPAGYSGLLEPRAKLSEAGEINWTPPIDSPSDSWWEREPATPVPGTVRVGRSQAGKHWERLLAESLGQAAAGRIEWVRLGAEQVSPQYAEGHGVQLRAVPAWEHVLAAYYPGPGSPSGISRPVPGSAGHATTDERAPRVRYVIGRAVRRGRGPCMNISGESRPGSAQILLEVKDLIKGAPAVVVLQAEPTDEEAAGAVRHYDLADKLQLATALLEAGVPAVLVVPGLPVSLAREVAFVVTAFALAPGWSGHEVRTALLRPLRAAVARQAGPAALDDIIMLLNARYA